MPGLLSALKIFPVLRALTLSLHVDEITDVNGKPSAFDGAVHALVGGDASFPAIISLRLNLCFRDLDVLTRYLVEGRLASPCRQLDAWLSKFASLRYMHCKATDTAGKEEDAWHTHVGELFPASLQKGVLQLETGPETVSVATVQ